VTDRFTDGQLYVNLRGVESVGSPVDPADAVRGFLDAFQVPSEQVPVSLDAKAALYRSLVSGRRMVIVLDDAATAEQVRPLLPGSSGCLVLVTSRRRLTGLIAEEGAYPLTLGLLSMGEARELLARCLGPDRVVAELPSADGIAARCSRLPLALAVVAARAATHPRFSLAALESELREARNCLDALDGGDARTDVRAALSWSYQGLSEPAARLFRLLGLHPGPDISVPAAASLDGNQVERVRPLLAELARAHLVEEHAVGRFTFHDLLRALATELLDRRESEAGRLVALRRMLDHYVHTAHAADRLLDPHRDAIVVAAPLPDVRPEAVGDQRRALEWFTTEHPALLTAIRLAANGGFDTHSWQLAWTLESFLDRCGHWHDWLASQRTALEAARRLADPRMQARSHQGLARAFGRFGRYDEADAHLREALLLFGQLDDAAGQADTNLLLATVFEGLGRHRLALRHVRQALGFFRAAGHLVGQAAALNTIGRNYARLDDQCKALTYGQRALDLHRELGNRHGEADALDGLGYAHHRLGQYEQAATCYQHALTMFQSVGDRLNEAKTLAHLGDVHHALGRIDAAGDAWRCALAILDGLGHGDADQIRARLFPVRHRLPKVSTQM
jgi:tetratricopeptide (TPR) repeat protein